MDSRDRYRAKAKEHARPRAEFARDVLPPTPPRQIAALSVWWEAEYEVDEMRTIGLGIVGIFVVGACASLEFKQLGRIDWTTMRNDAGLVTIEGAVYYRPRAYLLLTQVEKGCEAKIVWLPDYSQAFEVVPHAGWGSVTFNPTFSDGWTLSGFSGSVDTKTADLVNAFVNVAKLGIPAKAVGGPKEVQLTPGLYDLDLEALRAGQATSLQPPAPAMVLDFGGRCGRVNGGNP